MCIRRMFPIYPLLIFALRFSNSDGKSDLWSQQEHQDRTEALERHDLTNLPVIKQFTQELQDQRETLTAQQETINNLARLLEAQASNTAQKDKIITSLKENIDNLKAALERTDAKAAKLTSEVTELKAKVKVLAVLKVEENALEELKETLPGLEKEIKGESEGSEKLNVIEESDKTSPDTTLQKNTDDKKGTDNTIPKADRKEIHFHDQNMMPELEPWSPMRQKNVNKQYSGSTDNDENNPSNKTQEKQNKHQFLQRTVADSQVAFHARIDTIEVSSLGLDQTIKFEYEVLDFGGGYDSTTGIFTTPKAGLYLFSVTICSWYKDKANFNAVLVKNGIWAAAVTGHGGENIQEINQGSVTLVMQLYTGDKVWVKNSPHSDVTIAGMGYPTFTGILISET